jgi:hypothetical protein
VLFSESQKKKKNEKVYKAAKELTDCPPVNEIRFYNLLRAQTAKHLAHWLNVFFNFYIGVYLDSKQHDLAPAIHPSTDRPTERATLNSPIQRPCSNRFSLAARMHNEWMQEKLFTDGSGRVDNYLLKTKLFFFFWSLFKQI